MQLLSEGYMQAYIDFFYLTEKSTPSVIEPPEQYLKEFNLHKARKAQEPSNKEKEQRELVQLRDDLIEAEMDWRDGEYRRCFKTYQGVAQRYEEQIDYQTASYFHKRCLDVSLDFKYFEGEALAYKGLGFCEEKVGNKYESMARLETANDKATEGGLEKIKNEILRDLVRVYQQIAKEYQSEGQYEMSLQFYNKCVHVSE